MGRVTENRSAGKSTRYYMDEMHLCFVMSRPQLTPWKSGSDLENGVVFRLVSRRTSRTVASKEVENIFENSDFIYMLNQAVGQTNLAKQLNISPHQLSYVTHSGEGEGLLFYGNVILPFVDRFPTDLELYRIMTTKLNEVQEAKKEQV